MLETHQRHGKARLAATIISLIVVAGIIVLADHLKTKGTAVSSVTTQSTPPVTSSSGSTGSTSTSTGSTSSTNSSGTSFSDGTYNASSDYQVPDGDENIAVSLTLKGGVVTDASVQNSESDPTSASFQEDFASAFKSQVVGKKISGLQIGVVAGASDTSQAFNEAVSQIANKAQG